MDVKKLKEIILKPCQNIIKIPFDVPNYEIVIEMWKNYRKLDFLPKEIMEIKQFFDFHKTSNNHILLYSSHQLANVLLMCKVNGKYRNMSLPIDMGKCENFVAVYA